MTKRRRESKSSVAERRWLRSRRSAAIAGPKMCQIESSCDCRRATHQRIWLQKFRTRRHLAARTMSCLARLPQATGLESARDSGPSTATVDSDAARVTEFNRGISSGRVKDAHQEGTGSFSATLLRREKLIPDSMRKTTLANLETKTLNQCLRPPLECGCEDF